VGTSRSARPWISSSSTVPRTWVTRNDDPSSALPAVAPSTTINSGSTSSSSLASQGPQAVISRRLGALWIRRLRGSACVNLKCFTALVTYASAGSTPASARARSSSFPAGPTNGFPCRSS